MITLINFSKGQTPQNVFKSSINIPKHETNAWGWKSWCLNSLSYSSLNPDPTEITMISSASEMIVLRLAKRPVIELDQIIIHLQSDGMIEHFNRTLLRMLSSGILEEDWNWEKILPAVMMAYRTSIHKTMQMSPFMFVFGRRYGLPVDIVFGNPPFELATCRCSCMHALQLRNTLESAYHKVREYLRVESRRQKEGYDHRVKEVSPSYNEGDLVWLHCPAVPRGRSRKLHWPWKGLFVITKLLSDIVFHFQHCDPPRIHLDSNWFKTGVLNISLFKLTTAWTQCLSCNVAHLDSESYWYCVHWDAHFASGPSSCRVI